jgi:small subunit ribosomal protein S10e
MGVSLGASPELSTTAAPIYTRALHTARAWFASTSGCCSLATGRMLIPKKNRVEVYKYLFQEGVLYAKKDFNAPKHPEIDVPNLQVIKLMQSFKSKEYVKESFAWRHYYWYLTNDGIEHLRTYLNLPSEIVPATLKKSARPPSRPVGAPGSDRPPRGPPREGERPRFGDREGYRSSGGGFGGEKGGVPGDYRPDFRSGGGGRGFGRGGGGFNSGGAPSAITE